MGDVVSRFRGIGAPTLKRRAPLRGGGGSSDRSPVLHFGSAALAGSRHFVAYLRAEPLPTAVFAATDDWGDTAAGPVHDRIERAGRELADRIRPGARPASPPRAGARSQFDDTAADFVDFESLLNR